MSSLGMNFSDDELRVIYEIAAKQEITQRKVLIQALRCYQLMVMGTHELRELNPQPKMKFAPASRPTGEPPRCPACKTVMQPRASRIQSASWECPNCSVSLNQPSPAPEGQPPLINLDLDDIENILDTVQDPWQDPWKALGGIAGIVKRMRKSGAARDAAQEEG